MTAKNKKLIDTFPTFDISQELIDDETALDYLQQILTLYVEDGREDVFMNCLKPLIKAQGSVSDFAKKTGISRTYFYKLFNNKITPELPTLIRIISNLGYKMSFNLEKYA
ncbi:MAG TPA: helix-turn-helix domain-containing protein [Candidatus Gastranaerophilaceae bacterium]|nr:helix-turn-helix domain-containing protein [Candidatus Gastranaerophilaceae bacterium]HPT41537.1 helix-turn-helix domain-containing protein [Candidatus Gastranaerophilaceae bacterium]